MTPPDKITAPQLAALCALLWGDDWRQPASSRLAVSLRNVQHWAAGSKPVPPGVVAELFGEVARRMGDPERAAAMFVFVGNRLDQLRILFKATGFEQRDFSAHR